MFDKTGTNFAKCSLRTCLHTRVLPCTTSTLIAQLAGAVEYTGRIRGSYLSQDSTSAEGKPPTPPNECPVYDIKHSDGEVPVMLELWGTRSIPSLPMLPGPLWPGMVAPDKGPIYGQNRTNWILMLNWIRNFMTDRSSSLELSELPPFWIASKQISYCLKYHLWTGIL